MALKAKGRSLPEIRERASQLVAAELERRGIAQAGEPSDSAFWKCFDPSVAASVGHDMDRLHERFHRRSGNSFVGIANARATATYLEVACSHDVDDLVKAANEIRQGRFDLLGYSGLSFGSPIDWHFDPTTGTRSPRRHWSRIRYLDATVVGDHKVVWELNRHQHFMVLGRAYQVTGREEYADTFVEHVTSWMDENQPKHGVNWASSLEIAYRLIAWLWALELFRESSRLTASVRLRMLKYLYAHVTHVERYLSTYFSPNTHLTGEALGLLYAGLLLPELRRANRWASRGWSILASQLERQVHPDGVYFEQATHYQRYTADIYLHAILLAQSNGRPVPPSMLERVDALVDHLADLTRPDGSIPLIGDDDGGRLVALEERDCNDVRATLATAAVVFECPKYAYIAGRIPQETVWLVGVDRARALDGLRSPPTTGSRAFTSGGYVIMRDGWHKLANHAVIDCGPHGGANCGHSHADALAIDLTAHGCPLLIDPGTFGYTVSADDRDHFRQSAAHNTLTVDGASSSVPGGPFSWQTRTDAALDAWWTSDSLNYFAGSHRGFERLAVGAVHQRRVLFVKDAYWVVWDTLVAPQPHEVTVHWHTAPGTTIASVSPGASWLERSLNGRRVHVLLAAFGTIDSVEWGTDWVSECYGRRVHAPVCHISSRQAGRRDFISIVAPALVSESIEVSEVATNGGYTLAVRRADWEDLITLRTAKTLMTDSLSTDAQLAWIRRDKRIGSVNAVAIIDGCAFQWGDLSLDLPRISRNELRRTPSGWRSTNHGDRGVRPGDDAVSPLGPVR